LGRRRGQPSCRSPSWSAGGGCWSFLKKIALDGRNSQLPQLGFRLLFCGVGDSGRGRAGDPAKRIVEKTYVTSFRGGFVGFGNCRTGVLSQCGYVGKAHSPPARQTVHADFSRVAGWVCVRHRGRTGASRCCFFAVRGAPGRGMRLAEADSPRWTAAASSPNSGVRPALRDSGSVALSGRSRRVGSSRWPGRCFPTTLGGGGVGASVAGHRDGPGRLGRNRSSTRPKSSKHALNGDQAQADQPPHSGSVLEGAAGPMLARNYRPDELGKLAAQLLEGPRSGRPTPRRRRAAGPTSCTCPPPRTEWVVGSKASSTPATF